MAQAPSPGPGMAAVEDGPETTLEVLAVTVSGEEYAIPIMRIKEIIRSPEMTRVPRAEKYLLGIISLRGIMLPVFSLAERLKLAQKALARLSRIVVVQMEKGLGGLLVDGVTDVLKIDTSRLEEPPGVLAASGTDAVEGVARHKGRVLLLLDMERLFQRAGEEV